ncbi:MAG: hypothetical protein IPM29_17420 [Planctomycetes bacterium]|nr:hypothetical protein [Planctomycetota bacterium]MBK8977689.1 hypothetical protein [Planctomycetota bacterium]
MLLAIAADRHGASFYGRDRMAGVLGITRQHVDAALARLLDFGLVTFRPWRAGGQDGVWQLLPLPVRSANARSGANRELSIAEVLRTLGFQPRQGHTAE